MVIISKNDVLEGILHRLKTFYPDAYIKYGRINIDEMTADGPRTFGMKFYFKKGIEGSLKARVNFFIEFPEIADLSRKIFPTNYKIYSRPLVMTEFRNYIFSQKKLLPHEEYRNLNTSHTSIRSEEGTWRYFYDEHVSDNPKQIVHIFACFIDEFLDTFGSVKRVAQNWQQMAFDTKHAGIRRCLCQLQLGDFSSAIATFEDCYSGYVYPDEDDTEDPPRDIKLMMDYVKI